MQWPWPRRQAPDAPHRAIASPSRDWQTRFAARARASRDPSLVAYYRQPPAAADTPIEKVPLLALDLETTGLDAATDAIVSIGLVPFDSRRIQCRAAGNWLVNPQRPLVEASIKIHGITHSDLAAAPPFAARLGRLLNAMAGRVIVVHCNAIERQFLAAAVHALTGEPFEFPVIDTMVLEERAYPPPQASLLARLFGGADAEPVSLRLNATRTRYGLPRYRPHHALTDALATAELLQAQLQYHHSPLTAVSDLWM